VIGIIEQHPSKLQGEHHLSENKNQLQHLCGGVKQALSAPISADLQNRLRIPQLIHVAIQLPVNDQCSTLETPLLENLLLETI
jgi:hypothetical protein